MLLEELPHGQRVRAVPLHPQMKRLQPQQELERVERRQRRPEIAQQLHPQLDDERDVPEAREIPEDIPIVQPVVRRVGRGEPGEVPVPPVELSGVDDDAADRGPVAADELGGGVDHDVRPVVEGTHQEGGGHRVVHHQRDPRVVRDLRDRGEVERVELGVAHGFRVDRLRLLRERLPEALRVLRVDELHLDPQFREGVVEQVVRPAVEGGRRDDLVPRAGDVQQSERLRRLAGGHRERPAPPFQLRDPLLEDVGRRVHDPGIDVPELLQPEEPRRMRGIVEDVRGGLVDRHRPGVRRRIGFLPPVKGNRFRLERRGHRRSPFDSAVAS